MRLRAPSAGDSGSIPGRGTRSHVPQLRVHMPQLKSPRATTKTADEGSHVQQRRPRAAKHTHSHANTSKRLVIFVTDFPAGSDSKASACHAGDLGSIPGLGRFPGEGNGNSLQHACLENSMDRGAWWATAHGVAKSRTRLSNFTSLQ